MESWLNLDGYATGQGVLYYNALNRLPLGDASVVRIHCEHFLEHLDFDAALAFLSGCRRVLEPGGTMRLSVPDADKYLAAYVAYDEKFFEQLRRLGNVNELLETRVMVCN